MTLRLRGSPVLLEREGELKAIEAAVAGGAAGTGSILLLEGPAGIGKTTLLRQARELAREAGLLVAVGHGGELERQLPFGVVRELFDPIIAKASDQQQSRLLAGTARLALVALGREPERRPTAAADAAALIHGLYWFASNLSEVRPLTLVIDDLHWADRESLRFLEYFARRIREVAVFIVGAIRSGEPDEPDELEPLRLEAEMLELKALTPASVGDLIQRDLGRNSDRRFVETCSEATGGNPFLVAELLRAIRADQLEPSADAAEAIASLGPESVARHVLVRLGRFGDDAVALARAITVLGASPLLRHAAALAALSEKRARDLCDALRDAEILAPGLPIDFVHPLVRRAIYRDLSDGARSDLHRRAAEMLETSGVPPREVALHLLECAPNGDPWVLSHLRDAASQAMAEGAYEAARTYMERALREPSDDEGGDLFLLGRSTYETNPTLAPAILDAAAEAATDPALRIDALRWSANACMFIGNLPDVIRRAEELLQILPENEREQALALEAHATGFRSVVWGRDEENSARIRKLAEGLEGNTPGECVARQALSAELFLSGEPVEKVVEAASRFPPAPWEVAGYRDPVPMGAVKTLAWCGRWDRAAAELQSYIQAGEARGYLTVVAAGHGALADVWRLAGHLADAEVEARTALHVMAARASFSAIEVGAKMVLLTILIERGEVDAALELAESLPMWLGPREFYLPPWPAELRGYLHLARDEFEQGVEALLEVHEATESLGLLNPAMSPWRQEVVPALVALGRTREAKDLIREGEERARAFGAPHIIGGMLRARATLEPRKRRLHTLRESVSSLEGHGSPVELARSLMELGTAIRLDDRPTEARAPLRKALDLAHRFGAGRLEQRTRDELAAAGVRPRRPELTGPGSLTASEMRTAKLAAEGLSNKEIAQRLFVTLRTVETHLTHAYDKLQIRGRDELGTALDES